MCGASGPLNQIPEVLKLPMAPLGNPSEPLGSSNVSQLWKRNNYQHRNFLPPPSPREHNGPQGVHTTIHDPSIIGFPSFWKPMLRQSPACNVWILKHVMNYMRLQICINRTRETINGWSVAPVNCCWNRSNWKIQPLHHWCPHRLFFTHGNYTKTTIMQISIIG